jgi:hypothetical protein
MRYVTVRAEPPAGEGFHPIGRAAVDEPGVTPGPIHQIEMADSAYVIEHAVTGDDHGFVYTHFELDDFSRRTLEYRRGTELMIDVPIDQAADGSIRVTLVGEETAFTDAFRDVPAEVDLEVLETGSYDPGVGHLVGRLTARQREVLSAATVGEHLRKVERRVFSTLVDADAG